MPLCNSETLKVRAFYVAFAAVFVFSLWLANSYEAVRYALAKANFADRNLPAHDDHSAPCDELPPMPTIQTLHQLDVVFARGCSVVFLEADWSFNTAYARRVVYPLVRTWGRRGGNKQISFYRLDATSENPVVDALVKSSRGRAEIIADAALIIIKDGRVRDCIQWSGESLDGLFRRLDPLTRSARSEVVQ